MDWRSFHLQDWKTAERKHLVLLTCKYFLSAYAVHYLQPLWSSSRPRSNRAWLSPAAALRVGTVCQARRHAFRSMHLRLGCCTVAFACDFFLYGVLAGGVSLALMARRHTMLLGGLVLLAAVLIASLQWVPGFQLRESFIGNFTINSPYERASLTSFSGLYGMPSALIEDGQKSASQLYLTPGILAIPIFILLIMRVRRHDRIGLATLACLAIFAVMSMAAFDFWQFMPRFLWAVQFPYRLIAFVALFTAIGICVTLKSLKPTLFSLLLCLLVAQNWKLLWEPAYSTPLEVRQEEVGLHYPIVDYMIRRRRRLRRVMAG